MKVGIRTPSLSKRISSRTTGRISRTLKKSINPLYGKKGIGLISNPKKAIYNKVYHKTTFDSVKYMSSDSNISGVPKNNMISKTIKNNYTIVNDNEVIIGHQKYTKKQLQFCSNLINFLALFILLISIFILPIGIFFIIFSVFLFKAADNYKKICKELISVNND